MPVPLKILLWKNCKTEKRMWPFLLAEVLAILIIGILVIANPSRNMRRFEPTEEEINSVQIYNPESLDSLEIVKSLLDTKHFPDSLAYRPQTSLSKQITEAVAEKLELKPVTTSSLKDSIAILNFPNYTDTKIPLNLTVRIEIPGNFRTFHSSRIQSNLWLVRCTGSLTRNLDRDTKYIQTDLYLREGFLQLQNAIFWAWFDRLSSQDSNDVTITVQSFRYKTLETMCQPKETPNILSVLYYFFYFLPFLNLVWKYGRERQENMLAHHWRYDCSKLKYWSSHFIISYLHFFLISALIFLLTIISWTVKPKTSYENSFSYLYLLLFLALTIFELIMVAMMIVCLVPNATSAIYCSILIWLLLYAMFAIELEYAFDIESLWGMFSLITFFNNGFAYGLRHLMGLDKESDKYTYMIAALIGGSAILKFILLSIVQHFRPGCYMQKQSNIFMDVFCCRCFNYKKQQLLLRASQAPVPGNYQFGPLYGEKYVAITRVAKSLKKPREPVKHVLKKVSLAIFKGEITIILGHNGSGKTTLISLIAGWRKPDEGTILINNLDIVAIPGVKQDVDVSMPNNTLFDYMTAYESLHYFLTIKGSKFRIEKFNEEIKTWLKTLKVVFPKGEAFIKVGHEMTFEQKRVLALCCTMAGGTKIVLLDEPTLHMHSPEQRYYWSILQREKADRAIVVTTYSFREAETIGDRIAVMTDGIVKACGTPMFLKTTFGIGFDLVILKDKDAVSAAITDFLQDYIADIQPDSDMDEQVVYKIPLDKKSVFQTMLIQLTKKHKEFGIKDSRLLTTDLSDVYMSLGRIRNRQQIPEEPQTLMVDYLTKKERVKQQWSAMFFKKFTHQPSVVIPIFMTIFSAVLIFVVAQMLSKLRSRETDNGFLVLGYRDEAKSRYLSNMKNCKFIGIRSVDVGNDVLRERNHAYTFTKHSFYCSRLSDFSEHLKSSINAKDRSGHLYGAVEIKKNNRFDVYVNQHILHSAPLVLNLLHNYILETVYSSDPTVIARIVYDPMKVPAPELTSLLDNQLDHLYIPLAIGIVVPLTLCTFLYSLVEERNNNLLILMSIAGLRVDIYWLTNLIWDWLTFFAYSMVFQIVIIVAFYNEMNVTDSLLIGVVINVYSLPLLTSLYFISMFKFVSHYRAYLIASVIHIVSGIFAYVVYWDVFLAQKWFLYIFLFSPTFAMLEGTSNVYVLSKFLRTCEIQCLNSTDCEYHNICENIPECCDFSFLDWGNAGILRSIVFLLLTTLIIILMMFWLEIHRRESKFYVNSRIKKMTTKTYPYDDEDIVQMRERIARAELREITKMRLVVDQVESNIPDNSLQLSTISFDADRKSITGIYGTQHVGKSHLLRQIIGEDSFRFGDIYIRGIPIKYNVHDAWLYLGYCPQHEGIFYGFTVVEVLHFICLLRGVPKNGIPFIVNLMSNIFGLGEIMRRRIFNLSLGTQRKISIAVAMVASNKVVILDEPTQGLPQWIRREIWNALRYFRSCGKTIVFSTTDMHECDALANNVLLIEDGEMLAYGGSHYLKVKHVVGFLLEVRLRRDGNSAEEVEENLRMDVENVHRFMMFMHSDTILLNRIDNCLKFYLPVERVNFNLLYGSLEKNRARLNIIEYTVGQGNFEEVLSNISSKRDHKRNTQFR